jgi:HSP20 family protein
MTLPILRRGGSVTPLRHDVIVNGLGRLDPWNDFSMMDRLVDSFFRSPFTLQDRANGKGQQFHEPGIELYETADELVAYIYAPGLNSDSLDISVTPDQISIRGERTPRITVGEGTTVHTPWSSVMNGSGTLSASYTLPSEIDPEKVSADYKVGILEIHLRKPETTRPKQVKVQLNK